MYLKDAPQWLISDINYAKNNNFGFGIKLVRGAYVESERIKAKKGGYIDPIHSTKYDTDECFNEYVKKVVGIIGNGGKNSVAICTHNSDSLKLGANEMKNNGIKKNDNRVYFAQLKGMCDNLSFGMGLNGYNALKLIPYGDFNDVWPYLSRRFLENVSILGGMTKEKRVYLKEIKRRIGL